MKIHSLPGKQRCSICPAKVASYQVQLLERGGWLPCCAICCRELETKFKVKRSTEAANQARTTKAREASHLVLDKLEELGMMEASLERCAVALTEAGMTTAKGKRFSKMAVARAFESVAGACGWDPDGDLSARDYLRTLSL